MPAAVFPQALAMLIAFWVNGLLHGMYLILFMRWFFVRRGNSTSLYYNITTWGVFILSNVDTALNFALMILGFWESLGGIGPVNFFNDFSNWETVWREINYQIIVGLADLMMVHRLWVIWGHNYYLGAFALSIWIVELAFGFLAPARLALEEFVPLVTAINGQLGFNTALQVVITALLAYRILRPKDMSLGYMPSAHRARRRQLVKCFIESGALVTFGVVVDLILYAENVLFHWVFNISLAQLYAISTVMIVLRLNGMLTSELSNPGASSSISQSRVPPIPNVRSMPGPPPAMPSGNVGVWRGPDASYNSGAFSPSLDKHRGLGDEASSDIEMFKYDGRVPPTARNPQSQNGIMVHVEREQEVNHYPYGVSTAV